MAEDDLQIPAYDRTTKIVSLYGEKPAISDICYPAYDRTGKVVALRLEEAADDDLVIHLFDRQAAIAAAFVGPFDDPGGPTDLYVYGGTGSPLDCDGYSLDSWTSKTNLPAPNRWEHAASSIGGSAGYIYGGYDSAVNKDCDRYIPNAWTNMADLPDYGRRGLTAATIGIAGFIFGGYYSNRTRQDCDQFIPNVWINKTDMITPPRMQFAASRIGSAAYVYAGVWYNPATTDHDIFSDCDEYAPDTWTAKTNIVAPARFAHAAATIGSAGYVFAGSSTVLNPPADNGWAAATAYLQDCDQYVPDTWTNKTSMPSPGRHESSASTLGSAAYVCAGVKVGGVPLKDCDQYIPDAWANKSDLPSPARKRLAQSSI